MSGPVVALTGATGGIGSAVAKAYASRGARLILIGRDEAKLTSLRHALPGEGHSTRCVDLSSLTETRRLAADIRAAAPTLDILLNVAGVLHGERRETAEGHEETLAVNLLSPILLTQELAPALATSGRGRAVMTGSGAINFVRDVSPNDLQSRSRKPGLTGAYAASKAWLTLWAFTADLPGVTAAVADPGGTKTDMTAQSSLPWFVRLLRPLIMHDPDIASRAFIAAGLDLEPAEIAGRIVMPKKVVTAKPRFTAAAAGQALRTAISPMIE
ncbi:MAG: SDR family NAD(P)-dependent oxidoreductase [Pseudomonadota bacterium]